MFDIVLDLPSGAKADFNELQYISALHQSGQDIRKDGSVVAKDIVRYLSSRHGIKFDCAAVRHELLKDFCADEGKKGSIDLVEITSILLVPFLLKARALMEARTHEGHEAKSGIVRRYSKGAIPPSISERDRQEFDHKCDLTEKLTLRNSEDIVSNVLAMLVEGVPGSTSSDGSPPMLDKSLLRSIFRKYGLTKLANGNDFLLQEMIDCIGLSDQASAFDPVAFIRALTNDVLLFDVDSELNCTTNYQDAFHSNKSAGGETEFAFANQTLDSLFRGADQLSCVKRRSSIDPETFAHHSADDKSSAKESQGGSIKRYWTTPTIDLSSDTMRSKLFLCILLLGYLVATLVHSFFVNGWSKRLKETYCFPVDNSTLACQIGISVGTYFVRGIVFGALGWTYLGLGGLGNNVRERSVIPILVAIMTILGLNAWLVDGEQGTYTNSIKDGLLKETRDAVWVFQCVSLTLQFLIIVMQIVTITRLTLLKYLDERKRWDSWLFTHPAVRAEAALKQAAALKLNSLVVHAYDMHRQVNSQKSPEVQNLEGGALESLRSIFEERDVDLRRRKIRFLWTLKSFFSGDLLAEEGIWISSRAVASNFYMIAAIVWFITRVVYLVAASNDSDVVCTVDMCGKEADCVQFCEGQIIPPLDVCVAAVCTCSGCGPNELLLDPRAIWIGAIVGACVGVFNMAYAVSRYIPMYVVTILKFRTGVIPSLKDETFPDHRFNVDTVRLILGHAFWGPFISASLISFICASLVHAFVDPNTQKRAIHYFTGLAGIWICILLKFTCLYFWRKKYMGAFLRKSPAVTNIVGLFIECWNLILAPGYVTFRAVKLVVITIFHVARFDRPVLAQGAIVIQPKFLTQDMFPQFFVQDCLLHDAHRHPYLELLGKLYLHKLRYGDRFVSTAGSCWRLLFTLALMPWMHNCCAYLETRKANNKESSGANIMEKTDTMKTRMAELEDEIKHLKHALSLQHNHFYDKSLHLNEDVELKNHNSSDDEAGSDATQELQGDQPSGHQFVENSTKAQI